MQRFSTKKLLTLSHRGRIFCSKLFILDKSFKLDRGSPLASENSDSKIRLTAVDNRTPRKISSQDRNPSLASRSLKSKLTNTEFLSGDGINSPVPRSTTLSSLFIEESDLPVLEQKIFARQVPEQRRRRPVKVEQDLEETSSRILPAPILRARKRINKTRVGASANTDSEVSPETSSPAETISNDSTSDDNHEVDRLFKVESIAKIPDKERMKTRLNQDETQSENNDQFLQIPIEILIQKTKNVSSSTKKLQDKSPKNIKGCSEISERAALEIEELKNRTDLHIQYANEKQIEIQYLQVEIEALENETFVFEQKIEDLENEIYNLREDLNLKEEVFNATKDENIQVLIKLNKTLLEKDETIIEIQKSAELFSLEKRDLEKTIQGLEKTNLDLQAKNTEHLIEIEKIDKEKKDLLKIVQQLAIIGKNILPVDDLENLERITRANTILYYTPADNNSAIYVKSDTINDEQGHLETTPGLDLGDFNLELDFTTEAFGSNQENSDQIEYSTTPAFLEADPTNDYSGIKNTVSQASIWNQGIQAEMESNLENEIRQERHNAGLDVKLEKSVMETSSQEMIWEEDLRAEMESSLLNAVRLERHNSGLDIKLEKPNEESSIQEIRSEKGIQDEMKTSLEEQMRKERYNSGLEEMLGKMDDPLVQTNIWEEGIQNEMESSLLDAVRLERYDAGLDAKLTENGETLTQQLIWEKEVQNDMESSMLNAIRLGRNNAELSTVSEEKGWDEKIQNTDNLEYNEPDLELVEELEFEMDTETGTESETISEQNLEPEYILESDPIWEKDLETESETQWETEMTTELNHIFYSELESRSTENLETRNKTEFDSEFGIE